MHSRALPCTPGIASSPSEHFDCCHPHQRKADTKVTPQTRGHSQHRLRWGQRVAAPSLRSHGLAALKASQLTARLRLSGCTLLCIHEWGEWGGGRVMEMRGAGVQSLFVLRCMLCSAVLSAIEESLVAPSANVPLCRLLSPPHQSSYYLPYTSHIIRVHYMPQLSNPMYCSSPKWLWDDWRISADHLPPSVHLNQFAFHAPLSD